MGDFTAKAESGNIDNNPNRGKSNKMGDRLIDSFQEKLYYMNENLLQETRQQTTLLHIFVNPL